jgi:hypothetical protein
MAQIVEPFRYGKGLRSVALVVAFMSAYNGSNAALISTGAGREAATPSSSVALYRPQRCSGRLPVDAFRGGQELLRQDLIIWPTPSEKGVADRPRSTSRYTEVTWRIGRVIFR